MGASLCCPCQEGPRALFLGKTARTDASSSSAPKTDKDRGRRNSRANILPNNSGHSPKDTYVIEQKAVGSGAFGTVRKATSRRTGVVCALKTIKKDAIPSLDAFLNEVEISASLDHPNIVRLYETFEDLQHVYLVMEICNGGEMFDKIIEQGHFSELDASRLCQQILRAVHYMHNMCIAHRDLKPENFLLKERGVKLGNNTLKIIDFGIAARFTRPEGQAEGDRCLATKAGTAYYVAPEVLSGKYNEKCDIWSCGVILYILLCGSPPFSGDNDAAILKAAKEGKINFNFAEFRGVSQQAKGLILQMCTLNPRQRPSAAEVLNKPWVQQPQTLLGKDAGTSSLASGGFLEKLRALTSVNRFKKAALAIIAYRLDDNEIQKLRDTFLRLDKDGDGTLTLQEIKVACQEVGLTKVEDVQQIFNQLDFDRSGSVGYSEFLAAMIDQKNYLQEEVCWEAFRVFDRDNSGHISKAELRHLLENEGLNGQLSQNMSEKEINDLFSSVDEDGDGQISFAEFMAMMKR